MKKKSHFIDKNPELIYIIIGIIGLILIGVICNSLDTIFELLLYIIIFGVIIGLISFLIKIFW
jgi:hypothetical protein